MSLGFTADRQHGNASCRGRSDAPQHKALWSSVCHFLRCHQCGIAPPPHTHPKSRSIVSNPGVVSVCYSVGSSRYRACTQAVLFFIFFPSTLAKRSGPSSSTTPFLCYPWSFSGIQCNDCGRLWKSGNALATSNCGAPLHGSKWHVQAFCLPHFGSFDVMRSFDNMQYRRSRSQECIG